MVFSVKTAFVWLLCVIVFTIAVRSSDVIGLTTNQIYTSNSSIETTAKVDDALPRKFLESNANLCGLSGVCENGGSCVHKDGGNYCKCRNGTSGDQCEVVDECRKNPSKCGSEPGIECIYNISKETAECRCSNASKGFDSYKQKCRVPCKTSDDCPKYIGCRKNRDNDLRFCACLFGTGGDRCLEKVDECKAIGLDCGINPNVTCLENATGHAVCHCEGNWSYAFNYEVKDCVKCDCGGNNVGCQFFPGGEKSCHCSSSSYSQKDGKCEKCYCGEQSLGCSFQKDDKICSCYKGYIQSNGTCRENCTGKDSCWNGGSCVNSVCQCLPGTEGDLCGIVEGCQYYWQVDEKCGDFREFYCGFNVTSLKTYCGCRKKNYVYIDQKCKRNCTGLQVPCKNGGECVNSVCQCVPGTQGDWCDVVDGCRDYNGYPICGRVPCEFNQTSKQPYCNCKETGHLFDVSDKTCKECDCGKHGSCFFLDGEKTCDCKEGYVENSAKWFGKSQCEQCDCGPKGDCSFDEEGKKVCNCQNGYSNKNGYCVECNCGSYGECVWNNDGKTFCNCKQGYGLKNGECTECMCYWKYLKTNCTFPNGRQKCTCPDGYEESIKTICLDINECEDVSICPINTECKNTQGNYTCTCKRGYRPLNDRHDTKRFGCTDINECEEQNECPYRDTTECINTQGSYYCVCKPGYYKFSKGSEEYIGCKKDQTGWKIGYIILIVVFGVISFGLIITIFKKRISW